MPDTRSSCVRLTQILSNIGQSNIGQPIDARLADAESLAVKFISHCITAQYLFRGTRLAELGADFTDPASINVTVRAAVESVLTFFYLFVACSSDDELNFRHDAWKLADLQARQEFAVFSEEGKQQLAAEKKLIDSLQSKLRINPFLATLTSDQQKGVLFKQRWKLTGWARIGREMGLDENHAESFYSYLCSHAHSGYISVLQVQQARTAADQKMLVDGSVGVLAVAIAHMIRLYAKVFPQCDSALRQIPDAETVIGLWIKIGASTSNDRTTAAGYENRNSQLVVRPTNLAGTDHLQQVYVLRCGKCGNEYGANGSDIHERKCPSCQDGKPGLSIIAT